MNVAFLTNRLDKPSCRYRIVQYFPFFKSQGVPTEALLIPKSWIQKLRFYNQLKKFDIVVLQRKLLTAPEFYLLRKNARHLFFDFDDALIYKDSNQSVRFSRTAKKRFERTIRFSDFILPGNQYLMNMTRSLNSHSHILPTPVDTSRYTPKITYSQSSSVTIGWMGTSSTLMYLKNILPILEDLHKKYPQVQLKIVANDFFDSQKIPVIKKIWAFEEEIQDLHSFDIGLMPLTDDPWSRGKCGLKLLQYMASGIPSVCSPVGVNQEIISDGENGFHASTDQDWFDKIEQLILSESLRKKLGSAARQTALRRYSTEVNGRILLELFHKNLNSVTI